jgi:putative transposase
MKIQRAYKVELKLNNRQRILLEKSAGVARFAYNWALNERIKKYEENKTILTAIDQHKLLCARKKTEFPWMYEVSKCVPQEAIRDLDIAYKNFFRGLKQGKKKGFPKFKSKHKSKLAFTISCDFYITGSTINVPKVGYVRLKEKGYIPVKDMHINSMTVSKKAGRWFASVQCEQDIPDPVNISETVLGVDVGIKILATCSDGEVFKNNKYLNKSKKKLAHAQKNLARKQFNLQTKKSSKNRDEAKRKIQKIHYRISNQRKDAIHKMTSILARTKPRYIALEDLNVSGMLKNHCLAGVISDASFYEIKRQLSYKTAWYGGSVIDVNKFYPSSKLCRKCGNIKEDLTLNDRVYVCECGHSEDRDLNASINIENYGLSTLSSRGIQACGESVRLLDACGLEAISMKQEENMIFRTKRFNDY